MPAPPIVVVGAGPAGLAVAACLRRAGLESVILEQADTVGSTWRRHYDRLHLHTDKGHSALPFVPLPKGSPRYVSRDELVNYLDAYARGFALDIRLEQRVTSIERGEAGWRVRTPVDAFETTHVVVATGNARIPVVPTWPGVDDFRGRVEHCSDYRNGREYAGQRVLVVGFGNSGGEIAIDLHEHGAHPALSVRSAVNVIPKEVLGLPILTIGIAQRRLPSAVADAMNAPVLRMTVGDITKVGLRKLPYGPATQIEKDKHIPLIDIGTMKLIRSGDVTVHGGVERFTTDGVVFDDGATAQFDAVILATGYRPRVDEFVPDPATYDAAGTPLTTGVESAAPGLYYCGFHVSPTGMLREIGIEARSIADAIAAQRGRRV